LHQDIYISIKRYYVLRCIVYQDLLKSRVLSFI